MPDIFDEVAEDLRAERAAQMWRRFATPVIGALVLVIAGVAGWQGWQWYEGRQRDAAATAFLAAHRAAEAEGADLPAITGRFEGLAPQAPAGYRTIALLRAAALKAETGDRAAALALYDRVAADTSIDPLYRDLASLMWVLRSIDSGDPAVLAARIAPLARPDQPWSASARELAALVALRAGQPAEARRTLEALAADVTAPRAIRDRAQRIAAGIAG
ncbi:tetratricopeptide repeat protein [Roseomonas fluvialis]|uniref:tetratricopeptide repeat protein n=1 Tax=Roseomonas fluvialis TaxID=1750527 RepID=UPI001FCC5F3E|nr:tetratricopeptide repeat protein [Roseomonas fluvialis]